MSQQDSESKAAAEGRHRLRTETLEQILEVTQKLSAPYDLSHMLEEVIEAARNVLHDRAPQRRVECRHGSDPLSCQQGHRRTMREDPRDHQCPGLLCRPTL